MGGEQERVLDGYSAMKGTFGAYVDTEAGTVVAVVGRSYLRWQLPAGKKNFMASEDESLLWLGLEAARVRRPPCPSSLPPRQPDGSRPSPL